MKPGDILFQKYEGTIGWLSPNRKYMHTLPFEKMLLIGMKDCRTEPNTKEVTALYKGIVIMRYCSMLLFMDWYEVINEQDERKEKTKCGQTSNRETF